MAHSRTSRVRIPRPEQTFGALPLAVQAVVRAIVQIGQDVGLEVIAEGIETSAQEAMLHRIGCGQGQGYRYGKALPATEIGCLLEGSTQD